MPSSRPTPTAQIRAAELQRTRLEREREDLVNGAGRYQGHSVASALRELDIAERNVARLERNLAGSGRPRLGREEHGLQERLTGLGKQQESYRAWTARHPAAARRLDHLAGEIASLNETLDRKAPGRDLSRRLRPERWAELARTQDRRLGIDLGR